MLFWILCILPVEKVKRMVAGNGLIAKRFREYADDDRFLIFASGVSNSKSTDQAAYEREFNLLKEYSELNPGKVFVYFSTCSINDPIENGSAYVSHKKNIEQYIQSNIGQYMIFRVSNLVGKTPNNNTIFNFIVQNIRQGVQFDLWINATRNLIDVDDFFSITDHILRNRLFLNRLINIANPINNNVQEIVAAAEKLFDKKANYQPIPKGGSFNIDISDIRTIIEQLNIKFGEGYLETLLRKYY